MKRLNFLPRKRFAPWSDIAFIEISDRTQNAFLACAAAIALFAIVSFVETQRIVQAQVEGRRVAAHLSEVERREADVRTVAEALSSLGLVAHSVEGARIVSHGRLAAFARLGDILPEGVWITELAEAQQQIVLKGRARNAALLGTALRNIENDGSFHDPQLISAREHVESGIRYIDFEFALALTGRQLH